MTTPNYARKVYQSVVEDVITNVKEAFLDEGVDEQVLQELRQLWENKLAASRALEPEHAEPVPTTGNIPFQVVQQQQLQSQASKYAGIQQRGTLVQQSGQVHTQQMPVPLQISSDGQISNAASMAFSAQGGMFPQGLVNLNPGGQITLQQTANGQYILQALPPGVSQQQIVTLPQQQIMHTQQSQIQVQGQNLPQLDGTADEFSIEVDMSASCSSTVDHQCQLSDSPVCSSSIGGARPKRKHRDAKKLKDLLKKHLPQLDGNHDTSSSDDDNFDDDDDDDADEDKEEGEEEGEEEEPLNSDDDVSEEDPGELFDTDNVVVCQFEKISRNKNKWKFNLKDGIMNLDGKDHVFQKGIGEADW